MPDYLKTADVWTVLDLIVAEFASGPMSVQCFDLRLVERAKELNRTRPPSPDGIALARLVVESFGDADLVIHSSNIDNRLRDMARALIAKAEGR